MMTSGNNDEEEDDDDEQMDMEYAAGTTKYGQFFKQVDLVGGATFDDYEEDEEE